MNPYSINASGITPAWAGKRSKAGVQGALPEDHPRVGGEKVVSLVIMCASVGSPPRGRGKGGEYHAGYQQQGITPAWAGKSVLGGGGLQPVEDHPRVGGEKVSAENEATYQPGSPPRGRGKVLANAFDIASPRITPAWAGKSVSVYRQSVCAEDHPRVGGEKIPRWTTQDSKKGSPPRGRGKVDHKIQG